MTLLLAFITALFFGAVAQDAERTIPGSGGSCFRTDIGGCFSYAIGTFCSEYIYHVEVCCARPSFGTGYQVCHTSTWTTVNPNYRLHTGAVPAIGTSVSLEELLKRFAESNGLKPDDVVSFIVTDSDPFQGEDGLWLTATLGRRFAVDRSENVLGTFRYPGFSYQLHYGTFVLLGSALFFAWFLFFESGTALASPGKSLFGLRLYPDDGSLRITFGRSLFRTLCRWLEVAPGTELPPVARRKEHV